MSTKAKIQKVLAEVEAHEERGWLKGYEEGLAKREQQVVDLEAALEAKNQKIRELSHRKKGPTTAREALELAWKLAHPVKEGQEVQVGTELIARFEDGDFRTYRAKKPFEGTSEPGWAETRTLDPLPDPEPAQEDRDRDHESLAWSDLYQHAPSDLARATNALQAVLDIHKLDPDNYMPSCSYCLDGWENAESWPCPTVRAIQDAIGDPQ